MPILDKIKNFVSSLRQKPVAKSRFSVLKRPPIILDVNHYLTGEVSEDKKRFSCRCLSTKTYTWITPVNFDEAGRKIWWSCCGTPTVTRHVKELKGEASG